MTDKQWVAFDGVNCSVDWFETREDAEKVIRERIQEECELARTEGFSSESEDYWVLKVEGKAKLSLWKKREDQTFDDDGCDEDGDYWEEGVTTFSHLRYTSNPTDRQDLIRRTIEGGRIENKDGSTSHSVCMSFTGVINNLVRTKGREAFGATEAARLHGIARRAWFEGDFEAVADYFRVMV